MKHEFHPASANLISEFSGKPMTEKTKLVEELLDRANKVMRDDIRKEAGLDRLPDAVPFGAFIPSHKEVVLMGVMLGVYVVEVNPEFLNPLHQFNALLDQAKIEGRFEGNANGGYLYFTIGRTDYVVYKDHEGFNIYNQTADELDLMFTDVGRFMEFIKKAIKTKTK